MTGRDAVGASQNGAPSGTPGPIAPGRNSMSHRRVLPLLLVASLVANCFAAEPSASRPDRNAAFGKPAFGRFIASHCLDCHDTTQKTAGLALDSLVAADVAANLQPWE